MRLFLVVMICLGFGASNGHAQDARLASRLEPDVLKTINALIDSARVQQLPTEPLVKKALEGASKRASGDRIIDAVRRLVDRLSSARRALGSAASETELVAAAAALYAGVGPETLRRMGADVGSESVALRLVVLTDLINLGVTRDTAVRLITDLMAARVTNSEYVRVRDQVRDDITRGEEPVRTGIARVRGLLMSRRQDAVR